MKWILLISVLLLCSSCSNYTSFDSSLLKECTSDTPIPENGTGKAVLNTLIAWDKLYFECRERHNELVKAIRDFQ